MVDRKRILAAAVMAAACAVPLRAANELTGIAIDIAEVMEIILVMASLIELAFVVAGIMKGERDSVEKGIRWLAVTVVVFIVLSVMAGLIDPGKVGG